MNKFTLFVILCGLTFFSSSSLSQDALHKKAPPPLLVSHVDVLNELSERRRVSRFFKNEQSSFYGQQLGYVNTAKANTTFAVRDMVVAGRVPLVMARIYDSSLGEGGDFGQGWQLSFAQTIQKLADGSLLYRDGTADELRFIPASVGFNITPAQNSDIKAVDFNDLGQIEITYLDNWIKRFELLGGKYRLVSINDNNNNALRLTYVENQLSKISGDNNRAVTIYRNNGKIVRIEDNANRVVKYHYNAKDRLVGVDDLGGNQWKYRYHGTGLLHKVIDPEGKTAAKFRFGKDGKTTSAKVRWQKHNFQYQGNKTHVKDANGDETIFEHNASGITTAVINAEGLISQIELSDRNQITGLMHNNVQQAQIVYDENGRPLRYDINAKPTAMERNFAQYSYRYDGEGRTLAIEGAEKTLVNYEYDTKGNLTRHKTAKFDRSYQYADNGDVLVETESHRGLPANTTTYSYNADGLMASLTTSGQTARFDYNAVGRLAKVTFSDDSSHQYKYNKLGFRTQTTRSDHSLVDYGYDKVGNLTQSVKRTTATSEGKINGLTLNAQNQVTKITNDGNAVMSVKYSAKGNPVKITQGDISTEYQYDGLGRLTGVNDSNKGQVNYVYQADEEDIRLQFDDRTKGAISTQTKITGHNQTQTQLQYASVSGSPWQAVVWSPALAKFLVPSPEQIAAPDDSFQSSKQRRRLYDAKSTIKGHQINFDKPSNAFSKPAEYAVANCSTDDSGAEMDCYLYGVILDAASTITVGSPYTFSALAIADDDCLVKAYTFSIDNVIRGYNLSGLFPYTFDQPGQHSVQVTAECSCGGYFKWDGMSVEAQCPAGLNGIENTCINSVELSSPNVLTLLEGYTLTASVTPATAPVSSYKFEIRHKSASKWHSLNTGTNKSFASYAKVAGHFMLRTTVTSNNVRYRSKEWPIEIQFPSYDDLVASAVVITATDEAWRSTVASANAVDGGREEGFFIQVDTAARKYVIGPKTYGAYFVFPQTPKITIPLIADSNLSPFPLDELTYTIGIFHTHPPTFYWPQSLPSKRAVGPSDLDKTKKWPAIVYDYVEDTPGSGNIKTGHPLNAAAARYKAAVYRRATP